MATNGAAGAAAAARHQLVQAVRASGVIVQLEPKEFQKILALTEKALVVVVYGGFLSSSYKYLLTYKGFAFYTKSRTQLSLPGDAQTVTAKKMWVPQ